MFDYERLVVYQKAKLFNSESSDFLQKHRMDATINDQLRRATFIIVLNIAEGSGRFPKKDRKNFFVISFSSIFECVAIYDVLNDENLINKDQFESFYKLGGELSKILFKMIQNLSNKYV